MFSLYIGVGIYFIVLLLGSPRPANDNNSVVRAFYYVYTERTNACIKSLILYSLC